MFDLYSTGKKKKKRNKENMAEWRFWTYPNQVIIRGHRQVDVTNDDKGERYNIAKKTCVGGIIC